MSLFRQEPTFVGLPDEVLVHILSYLSAGCDIVNISRTCVRLQKIAMDDKVVRSVDLGEESSLTIAETLAFFSAPVICDKISRLNLHGVSVNGAQRESLKCELIKLKNLTDIDIKGIQFTSAQFSTLMSELPSVSKLCFTFPWYKDEDVMKIVNDQETNPYLKKITKLKIHFSPKKFEDGDEDMPAIEVIQMKNIEIRTLQLHLSFCKNLEHLEIYSVYNIWMRTTNPSDPWSIPWSTIPIRAVKLPKMKYFVMYLGQNSWGDGESRDVMKNFIRKMLGKNKQKLEGWCRIPGIGKVKWDQEVKLAKILVGSAYCSYYGP